MLGFGWVFGENKSENCIFHTEELIYNLQILISKLISLSKIQLLVLSVTFRAKRNFSTGWNCA